MSTRREFLKAGALAGGGLLLEIGPGPLLRSALAAAGATAPFRPNAWLRVGSDDIVTVVIPRCEMGQGVRTSLAMLVAEELDADWSRVRVETAMPGPDFPRMRTSGSWSVGGGWQRLRTAGAGAREMLRAAAAKRWKVAPEACATGASRVRHPASGRSLTYGALAAEAAAIPVPKEPALKAPADFTLIGREVRRIDARDIVTGRAAFGHDVRLPGMVFASVERCPVIGGRVVRVDPARARAVPGVIDVVQVPSGVAVVARDTWSALRGREALAVEWDQGANAGFDSRGYQRELVAATNREGLLARRVGDMPGALSAAATRLEAVYECPFHVHAPLEPMVATAEVKAGACELWLPTQAPNQVHERVAKQLGIEPAAVRVHVTLMGGGFGRRLGTDVATEAVEVARAIKRPVQVVWTRRDDMRHGFFQHASAHRLWAGLGDGRIVAWHHRMAGWYHDYQGPPDLKEPELAEGHMWGAAENHYGFQNMLADHVGVESPMLFGPWRAVHYPPNLFARECFFDEVAAALKRDPLELRRALVADAMARDNAEARAVRGRLARVLEAVAERSGWGRPLPQGRGRGVAATLYHDETAIAQVAEVSVAPGGRVKLERMTTVIDCGRVVNPLGARAQVESAVTWGLSATLFGEISVKGGVVEQESFVDYPIPRLSDTPAFETHFLPSQEPPLGLGEQPVATVSAAIVNAIAAATGTRVRRLPVRAADLSAG